MDAVFYPFFHSRSNICHRNRFRNTMWRCTLHDTAGSWDCVWRTFLPLSFIWWLSEMQPAFDAGLYFLRISEIEYCLAATVASSGGRTPIFADYVLISTSLRMSICAGGSLIEHKIGWHCGSRVGIKRLAVNSTK